MGQALLLLAMLVLAGCGKATGVREYEREHAAPELEADPAPDAAGGRE